MSILRFILFLLKVFILLRLSLFSVLFFLSVVHCTPVQCKCLSTQQCAQAQQPRDKTYTQALETAAATCQTSPYGCIWDTVTEISICLSQ